MLSTPKAGWTNISIGNWSDRASYLTSVPNDLLDALITHMEQRIPTSVRFDAEGWEYLIVFNFHNTYIIEEEDDCKLIVQEISQKDIAKELCDDITRDIDLWANWDYDICREESVQNEKASLQKKLEKLKTLLETKR